MEKTNINLQEALELIASLGLTVTTEDKRVVKKAKKRISNRRSKGSGSIVNLGKGRKKPYGALVTLGYDEENGRQLQKYIGYYATREEAQEQLDLYNLQKNGVITKKEYEEKANTNVSAEHKPTFERLYKLVFDEDIQYKSKSTQNQMDSAFRNLNKLHNMYIDEISLKELQPIFDESIEYSKSKLNQMKVVCSKVFNYAMKYDYVAKDYSSFISIERGKDVEKVRTAFTMEEINTLLEQEDDVSRLICVALLTGMRPQELINIKTKDLVIEEHYFKGGMKTKNGIDRIIPIHDKILPIVSYFADKNKDEEKLFFDKGVENYRYKFKNKMIELGMKHECYETRHTFATICKVQGINEYARQKIMGHASGNLTDDVYTHAPAQFLYEKVNELKL